MSKLLINESPLQVLPSLAVAIGLNEAIFLQQLHYWLTPTVKYKPHYREHKDVSRPWVYNTYHAKEETGWQANFPFWSVRTIKRIVTNLKVKGLIIVTDKFNSASSNRTLWYTIDYDKLATYETSGTLDSDKLSLSRGGQVVTLMTETTTEKTTDISSTKNSQNQNGEDGFDRADQAERDNLNALADQVAKVCGNINLSMAHPNTKKEIKAVTVALYMSNVTPDDLIAFGAWWYNEPWQGKKGQPPTLKQLGDMWGQFEAAQSTPASSAGPELSDVAKANYARLLAEQTK